MAPVFDDNWVNGRTVFTVTLTSDELAVLRWLWKTVSQNLGNRPKQIPCIGVSLYPWQAEKIISALQGIDE